MRDIDKYSDGYLEEGFEIYQVEYRRRMIMEQIDKYHPCRILEIGCGAEPLFQYVKGKEWVIVEPAEVFCEMAKEKICDDDCVEIMEGFFEDHVDKLQEICFDMIICSSVLQEVEKPEYMLECISRVCGEHTVVHINVTNAKSFHRVLARNMGIITNEYEKSQRNVMLQQNTVFDMDTLTQMAKEHYFEVLDQGNCFLKPFSHKQMGDMMEQNIINKTVLDGLYRMAFDLPDWGGAEIFLNCRKIDL